MSAARALLRMAWRDAARARGRSVLICLMIALPVFAATFADVMARTADPDADEVVERRLGTTQYVLTVEQPGGTGLMQAPDPMEGTVVTGSPTGEKPRYADLRALIPADRRVLTSNTTAVQVRTRGGRGEVTWREVAAADPAFEGRYEIKSGRAPATRGEVLATPELLARIGTTVGGTLSLIEPAANVVVTGTVREAGARGEEAVYALPGTLIGRPRGISPAATLRAAYVAGGPALTWREVLRLNRHGVTAYDRDLAAHPPPRSEVPFYSAEGVVEPDDELLFALIAAALIAGFVTLEVVLLAGAAFAVGAKRQAHTLALLAATGATARHVRLVVLAGGLVLGAVAAAVGIAAGILAAAVARPPIEELTQTDFARFDVRPLELLGVGAFAVVTGVLAAMLPARRAARQDVVAALAGRPTAAQRTWRGRAAGGALAASGLACSVVGSAWATAGGGPPATGEARIAAGLIAGGAALAVLGLVVLSPTVIGLAARAGRWLPLAPRLVVRDAARHRGRSAPALSAVLAAVAGSAALLLVVAATDAHDRRMYVPQLPPGTAGISLIGWDDAQSATARPRPILHRAAPVIRAIDPHLPVRRAVVVHQLAECASAECRTARLALPPVPPCPGGASGISESEACAADPGRQPLVYAALPDVLIGDARLLRQLYGVDDPRARAVLAAGGLVAFNRALIRDGRVPIEVFEHATVRRAEETGASARPLETVRVPAVHVRGAAAPEHGVLLSRAAAARMGLEVVPGVVVFALERAPTQEQEDAASAALLSVAGRNALTVERGYRSDYGLGLLALVLAAAIVTLGAAGIATALAQADARADHATLAAVGAQPRMRRVLSALQALLISGLGTALGVAVGFVPAVAVVGALPELDLELPWALLAGLLFGVPLLAASAAGVCTRSRLPLKQRLVA